MVRLAATPPAAARTVRPVRFTASMARGTSSSLTAAVTDAARLGRSRTSPFWAALWIRFTAAVFKPEKDISRSFPAILARGRGYLAGSPPWARSSMGLPPG